ELENEKAVATIPSTAAGTVTKIFVKSGDKISVGQRILSLSEGGAAPAAKGAKTATAARPKPAEPEGEPAATEPEEESGEPSEPAQPEVAPAAAPSIRKL